MSTALEKITKFDAEQIGLIKAMVPGCNKLNENEFAFFLHVAQSNDLDPLQREIYALKIWDPDAQAERLSIGTGIDGWRRRAASTGCYAPGKVSYGYDAKGALESCTVSVRVWHAESRTWMEVEETAYLAESARKKKDGSLMRFWREMPRLMLSKVAEARVIRKAFPRQVSGLSMHDHGEVLDGAPEGPYIDIAPEDVAEVPEVAPAPSPPPAEPTPKRGPGRPRKQPEAPPPPVETTAEPVPTAPTLAQTFAATETPEPPARPVPPPDGAAVRQRLLKLATDEGVADIAGRLKSGMGLPMDLGLWTPDQISELERRIREEGAARRGAKEESL